MAKGRRDSKRNPESTPVSVPARFERNKSSPPGCSNGHESLRHLIENFFCKLKEFKRIGGEMDDGFEALVGFVGAHRAVINSR
jgi:hypothetical protein